MHIHHERGIALVLALFLMSALSILGASLMFLSQTETYASMNYRMMSQARYAAEGGVQKAANFLLDSAQYTVPSVGSATDPLSNYVTTASPVTYNGQPVVLSADSSTPSNYPYAAAQAAFNAAAQGTLAAGNATLTYKSYATLVSMQKFDSYGGTPNVVQTWEITADGGLASSPKATVEVLATIETPKVSANSYAAFATSPGCDAIYFHGNVTVDSYDSSVGGGIAASLEDSGGDVGTNGNLHITGSVQVQGNLYTPRTGVGDCTEGNVTGLTEGGSADVTGSEVQLPTAVVYPPPVFSVTPPTTAVTINAALLADPATACSSLGLTLGAPPVGSCTVSGTTVTVDNDGADVTMPSVTVDGGFTLTFTGAVSPGQNVNINSLNGMGSVEVNANIAGPLNESVVLKIAGKNADGTDMTTPFDLSTMSWKQNSPASAYDASALQIVYNGTAEISMQGGNSQSAATIYAPNASFTLSGTQDLYGSILARTITNGGNASIHYDRRLSRDFYVAGNPMIGTFTWKTY